MTRAVLIAVAAGLSAAVALFGVEKATAWVISNMPLWSIDACSLGSFSVVIGFAVFVGIRPGRRTEKPEERPCDPT